MHGHAQVIVMFGEIDCREGLLLAVDKLKYGDIQEAMGVLADIYVEVLTRTVRERNLHVFVHPVPPVLNETRHIVTPFNDLLRERVRFTQLYCFGIRGCMPALVTSMLQIFSLSHLSACTSN